MAGLEIHLTNCMIWKLSESMGKFEWGLWFVIIFLHVQLWMRLAAVNYRGKKVRTVASNPVRSVNKSRDTQNCVQNEPEYAICVTTLLYYKALVWSLCDLIWQIRHNYNGLDIGHCDITGHPTMWVLGTAGAMVTTHNIPQWCNRLTDQNCFWFCKTYLKWKVVGFTLWCCL